MTVSKYFNHVNNTTEQQLLADLTIECIQQRGLDLFYIVRTEVENDYLFGEDPCNIYDVGIELEFKCDQIADGFDGSDGIGRFGLEIPDTATFICSSQRFEEEVTKVYPIVTRPREGDLIVFKTGPDEPKFIFEITFVDKEVPFYCLGKTNVFKMEAEKFNYSHETMNTGITDIDTNDFQTVNETKDNIPIQTESDTFVDFQENDPFSENNY